MPNEDSSVFDKALDEIESRVEGKFLTGDNLTIAGNDYFELLDYKYSVNYVRLTFPPDFGSLVFMMRCTYVGNPLHGDINFYPKTIFKNSFITYCMNRTANT